VTRFRGRFLNEEHVTGVTPL